jgi:hypothetical protein
MIELVYDVLGLLSAFVGTSFIAMGYPLANTKVTHYRCHHYCR